MPQCKKCDFQFKNLEFIEGKQRNLSNRKYCLICSPFKSHNTTDLTREAGVCTVCFKRFEPNRSKGHRRTKCNSCWSRTKHHTLKQKYVDYKGGSCVNCGYNRCLDAMDFHHTDPAKKEFAIGGSYNRSWNSVKLELDKCILLCKNCHAEKHSRTEM